MWKISYITKYSHHSIYYDNNLYICIASIMNNLRNLPKWGNFGQSGVNLDSGKKGHILVELVV